MKTMEFKYTDLKDGRVLIEVIDFNRDYFHNDFYREWEYGNIDYAVHTSEKEKGFIKLYIINGKLVGVEIGLGIKNTFSIIPKKYVYIFKDLENKVFNIEENLFKKLKIEKEKDDIYYNISYDKLDCKFFVKINWNCEIDEDLKLEKQGNVFKTREEAEEFLGQINDMFKKRKEKILIS